MKENKNPSKGVIHLQGMEFYAYHGMLAEERKLGQRFLVDVDIYPSKWVSGTDDIADTINYAEVYSIVKNCVEKEIFQLIESLAEAIADSVLEGFECEQVRVEVHKPNAPIPGIFGDVSVEIFREKNV